jgi:predicted alpha/beta-fold hydrolase
VSETNKLLTPASSSLAPRRTEEFSPRRFLRNGHLQTLVGNFLPRQYVLPEPEAHIIEVDPGEVDPGVVAPGEAQPGQHASWPGDSRAPGRFAEAAVAAHARGASYVLCHCHWQANPGQCLTVLLVHGLEGSSRSQYVLGNSARAWAAGCNVVRMNMRNCGGTENLSPTLYHSGLSADVAAVMRRLAAEKGLSAFALVGYSMGGNLVLKLAGELGEYTPDYLKAVVGVSPAMDLAVSADALHNIPNRVYEWKFLVGLRRRFRVKAALFPAIYSTEGLERIATLRQFDDQITARYSGFRGADDYYYRASSSRLAAQISVPTLILHALDDPFIRMLPSTRETLLANRRVELIEAAHGGHCAFLASRASGYDGYWAEKRLLGFLLSVTKP